MNLLNISAYFSSHHSLYFSIHMWLLHLAWVAFIFYLEGGRGISSRGVGHFFHFRKEASKINNSQWGGHQNIIWKFEIPMTSLPIKFKMLPCSWCQSILQNEYIKSLNLGHGPWISWNRPKIYFLTSKSDKNKLLLKYFLCGNVK